MPIVKHLGIDSVHFGALMMIIVTLGSMTPPVGVAMYTRCSRLDCDVGDYDVGDYIVESVPFVVAVVLLVALLIFLPDVVLFIPRSFF